MFYNANNYSYYELILIRIRIVLCFLKPHKDPSKHHKHLINPPSLCKFSERIIRRAVCQVPRREILQDPHISRRDLINNGYGSRRDSHLTSRRDHHIIIKQTNTSRRDYHVLRRLRSRL